MEPSFKRADASAHLDLFYGQLDCGVLNLCRPAGDGLAVVHRASLADPDWKSKLLDSAARETERTDLWIQFNPVQEGIQDPHRGTAGQTAVLVGLFADGDVGKKNTPASTSDALEFLR